ncbi:MAG: replication-associated recombination protein A [Salinivirgaceae bacterium]|nr:replication-associated recombination protein A [Salinivirgaceae bacterium]
MTLKPLAERLRPKTLDEYIGQTHLIAKDAALRKAIEKGFIPNIILWGPPGVGKTTLAKIIAYKLERPFYILSAVSSGVKDVRETIAKAEKARFFNPLAPLLFIDEIHRFSKSQQDSLLAAVELGTIVLIGATTENPSFEVIGPLLSRCQVYTLKHLDKAELEELLDRAITKDSELSKRIFNIVSTDALFQYSGGDARKLLNILEILANNSSEPSVIIIDNETVTDILQENIAIYDKDGELHYDIISAFIKSVRGSDPNAALYWLARMLNGGEDVKFIARRLIILAAEDIGLANPNALLLTNACFETVHKLGMPEARIILSETTIYLATSPKSNSAYTAIDLAIEKALATSNAPVPLHLRNAPTKLMKQLGYGVDYKYAHNYPNHFAEQSFLPADLDGTKFYQPANNQQENIILERLKSWWKKRYKY